jgi:nucleotide-binding universal stress UspA family protein
MKSIIVPVNFSACATNAANYAADLAQIIRADLHLIHVLQVPVTSADMAMTEYLYEEMVDSANTALMQLQADLGKRTKNKVRIGISLETGGVVSKVKEISQRLKPYAIVLGASGPTLEKFMTGSPVSSLLSKMNCPVLAVPENARFQHFHRVLLACDLNDLGSGIPHSMPLLKDLRNYFGTRFDIITVETPAVLAGEQKVFQADGLKEQLRDLYPEIHFIRTSKVEKGIFEYLGKNDADLVMVFPKKHGIFDFHVSQSRKLATHSTIPVMSFFG